MFYLNLTKPQMLFQRARSSKIFVDKSLMIEQVSEQINTNDQCICVTRPRRFGKTINAAMLAAYYTKGIDSSGLFGDLNISKKPELYTRHLNQHNVFYIDFSHMPDDCQSYSQYIHSIRSHLKQDLIDSYPFLKKREYDSLRNMMEATNDTFVFILDEWDSIFQKAFMTTADKQAYLEFLRDLLKDQPYVKLAYMTRVLPIAKYGSASTLNMFQEYHAMGDGIYDTFFGFTDQEVKYLCSQ